MTKREAEARAAAHRHSIFPDTQEAFVVGYLDGHAKGVGEAAEIARKRAADCELASEQTVLHDKTGVVAALKACARALNGCEQAIRAVTKGTP